YMILLFHNFLHFAKLLNKKYGTHTEARILHLHKIFYSAKVFLTTSDSITKAKGRLKKRLNVAPQEDLDHFIRNY
ncbi:hypothetical protein ACJEEU_09880, partial [Bacteroides salyersiae]